MTKTTKKSAPRESAKYTALKAEHDRLQHARNALERAYLGESTIKVHCRDAEKHVYTIEGVALWRADGGSVIVSFSYGPTSRNQSRAVTFAGLFDDFVQTWTPRLEHASDRVWAMGMTSAIDQLRAAREHAVATREAARAATAGGGR